MSYLFGVGGILLFQAAFSYALILASAGNGSFVGLGVMLFAVMGIPATALANLLILRGHRRDPSRPYLARLLLLALVLPAIQLALLVLVTVFNL